ncbi:MAG TPA: ATP synthase A1 subunit C [Candidatus Methanoperedenaceae archaeon]|nr:ATP synthase A1 subunit C [Candidatus Methanoperedenaceae archaeon]
MGVLSKLTGGTRYAYITARVRGMKRRLLPKEMYPKLLNMEIPEITRLIEETEYKKDVDELARDYSGTDLVEHALSRNLAMTYRKLLDISTNEPHYLITEYLRQWDIWNIKTVLRGKYYGAVPEEILKSVVSAGQLRYRDITEIAKLESVDGVIAALSHTPYYPVLREYRGGMLSHVENELDKLYYARLLESLGDSEGEKLFLRFLRIEIDIKNIKNLFRLKRAGAERDAIMDTLIPGGFELGMDELVRLAAMSYQEFSKSIEGHSYWQAISSFVKDDMGSLRDVEVGLESYSMNYASRISHYYPLSILPVMEYMLSKKIEVDNLRIIVRGKATSLSMDIIKRHLVM